MEDFFEYCSGPPRKFLTENSAQTSFAANPNSGRENLSANVGTVAITGGTRNTFTIFRDSFKELFGKKFTHLSAGSRRIDNLIMPSTFVTTTFLGDLENGQSVRIELQGCGVVIGIGATVFDALKNRKFIGLYERNNFDLIILAQDLRWRMPDDFRLIYSSSV